MKVTNFKEYIVWQKGHVIVIEIYKETQKFPKEETFGLVSQIRRSCSSICANIAEGYKKSRKEFIRYLDISQGSLEETKYHLLLSKDLQYLSENRYNHLLNSLEEVGKILYGLRKKLKQ